MSQGFVNPYTYATSAPTVTTYTSGSGTYTTPAGVKFLVVELVGGGGGGGGGGTTGATTGATGGTTTFGSLSATGGGGGPAPGNGGGWGVNSPGIGSGGDINAAGGIASPLFPGNGSVGVITNGYAAAGGNSIYGGGGVGGSNGGGVGGNATGYGGGGGGAGGTNAGGGITATVGGSGGGYCRKTISNPSATYSYSVGAGGASGTVGTNGSAGGAGSGGIIIIYEYYEVLGIPTTLTLPLPVSNGGTGVSTNTAYGVLCGGTTSTGALQSIASVGTSGQVLTSNGAGALPTFQTLQSGNVSAWVNFDGAAAAPTIRASGNVTSITDNGTGDYTLNFTTAFADANYAIVGMVRFTSSGSITVGGQSGSTTWQAAGSARINVINTAGSLVDALYTNIICVR